ncbi:MAG: carotenoid biosynthesis protein, partial [Candidatus Thermoplasmatota archaeon]|nr:carotenoid biosynthesis protein [Candidatus Thermoplasmatota archaeon]
LPNPGWSWLDGGAFFGVPPGNFFGWFLVACSITIWFRIYGAFSHPKAALNLKSLSYAPAIYFAYFAIMGALALEIGRLEFLLVGAGTMLPAILVCVVLIFGNQGPE